MITAGSFVRYAKLTFYNIILLTRPLSSQSQLNILDFTQPEETLITNLKETLTRYGFAQINNIPSGLITDMQTIAQSQLIDFFDQPINHKHNLTVTKPWQFGYIPLNFESTNGIYDTRETFAIGTFPETRINLGLEQQYAINVWPDSPQFKLETEKLLTKMHQFSIRITELFCKTLNKDYDCLYKLFDQNSSELRFTKYLSLQNSNGSRQGVGAHTDSGFMAFIFQTCKGLEFYDEINNKWINVDYHNDTTLIINIGDLAKLLSNGLYHTPKHRVLLQNDVRYTILYFFNPNYNEQIKPLSDVAKYQTLTWKQYLNQRFNSGSYSSGENRKSLNDFLITKREL
eukprot:265797_1